MARDAVAVYIHDAAIRVLRMSGKKPRDWATDELEPGLVRDGHIVNEEQVAAQLRLLWSTHSFGSQRVIAGISGINCMYRFLTLPELPSDVLPEAVTREASRAFGVPLDQLYVSWQAMPGKPGETIVYATAAARSTVDALMRTLKRAGLNPFMMDIAPLAIARATSTPHALIVDLQKATLDIVVKMGAIPEVVRTVPLPPSENVSDRLPVVREELQRAVTFYNSGHPDSPIPDDVPILVAGQLGDTPDLWPELLGRAKRPVEIIPCEIEPTEDFPAHAYVPAIGLALKETVGKAATAYSLIDFNALPNVYKPKRTPLKDLLYIPFVAVCIAALALGGYLLATTQARTEALRQESTATGELALSMASELRTRQEALEEQKVALEDVAAARNQRVSLLENQLEGYENNKNQMNGDLSAIHSTPAGINISSLSHSGSVVDISGWGRTEEAVFMYARQLRATDRFSEIVVTRMGAEEVGASFSFVLYKQQGAS